MQVGEKVLLSGEIYTARDKSHKFLIEDLENNNLPFDIKDKIIYYAGPCPATEIEIIGPIGPTTSKRMDKYAPKLHQNGFTNSVAVLKWKTSPWQLKKLRKVTNKVISALDYSDTGDEGTEILRQHFDEVIRFPFPYNRKDCGEMTDLEMKIAKSELRRLISR